MTPHTQSPHTQSPQRQPIDSLTKGIGALAADGSALPWRLLEGEVALPAAVLRADRIEHNLQWMQRFIDAYGLKLAPHGKTTMAPALFQRQIAGGAWGITVATAQQAQVAVTHGIQRVLIANQLIGKANIALVAELLARNVSVEIFSLVDSPQAVAALNEVLAPRQQHIDVLLELAPTADQSGYRTGVRTAATQAATLAAIAASAGCVRLAGVEIYEGVLSAETEIRHYLRRAVATLREINTAHGFTRAPPILSGAGSAWYDVVAEEFAAANTGVPVDIVLRPGCYLSHDAGLYREAQKRIFARNPIAAGMRDGLLPALQIWAYVQSIPSPERAVITMGKRDAAFDAGLPQPVQQHRPGRPTPPRLVPGHWQITGMMDQHAFMTIAADDDVQVGDMIAFDISHPCLTFDRWRQLLMVDEDYRCIDTIATFF